MCWKTVPIIVLASLALGAGVAAAAVMHPELGAHLSGMGEHGVANIKVTQHDLCWTFDIPTKGATASSIRDAHGMTVVKLGTKYSAKDCAMASAKAIATIDESPSKYWVWVDTKGHPGELRGKLFAGMAHM